ncbi:iron uptake transporter permease EfeU [Quadrisphaera sp. KR29]|uniref:iron uptake transporter permease EfeU n=1 Tax=Quadrisphaera sp. KR29 TaxID=3461391 RepID=UPI004044C675
MIANFLIGLREGLEATIMVSILVAFLVKTGRRDRLGAVRWGVAVAVALPVAVAVALAAAAKALTFEAQEVLGGTLSIVAVAFVTWMVFWMRRAGRHLASDLTDRMRAAVAVSGFAVGLTAFLAVGREGLETVFFVYAAGQATGQTWQPLVGALLGLAAAVVLGWALYRQAVRIDLRRFFTWTGAALVVVAGGVLAYGVHDLQEAGVLPGLHALAFDVSAQVPPASWYGVLLKGVLNFSPATTWAQAVAWTAYVLPVLALYLRPQRRPAAPAPSTTSSPALRAVASDARA